MSSRVWLTVAHVDDWLEDEDGQMPRYFDSLYRTMRKHGIAVLRISSFDKAVTEISGAQPDAVLMDIHDKKSREDGRERGVSVIAELKHSAKTKHIPIVVFTRLRGEDLKAKVLNAGADAVLHKEREDESFREVVSEIVKVTKGSKRPTDAPYYLDVQTCPGLMWLSRDLGIREDAVCSACGDNLVLRLEPDAASLPSGVFRAELYCIQCGARAKHTK